MSQVNVEVAVNCPTTEKQENWCEIKYFSTCKYKIVFLTGCGTFLSGVVGWGCQLSDGEHKLFWGEHPGMVERVPDGLSWWRPDQGQALGDALHHLTHGQWKGRGRGINQSEHSITVLMIDQSQLIFTTFDKDGNGWIDFNEFMIATHCTASSSPEDKLRWVFQLYDKVEIEVLKNFSWRNQFQRIVPRVSSWVKW